MKFPLMLVLITLTTAQAQRETFDLVSFIPPQGWERSATGSVVSFVKYNDTHTGYCLIGVYGSRAGSEDLQKEFEVEWNDLVKRSKNIELPPADQRTIQKGENGWNAISGSGVGFDKVQYNAVLVTIVGFGKVVSMIYFINDENFVKDVSKFVADIQMLRPAETQTTQPTSQSTVGGNPAIVGMWRSRCNDQNSTSGVTNSAGTGYAYMSTTTNGLRVRHILFLADGTFAAWPGLYGFMDYKDQRAKGPDYWGSYAFNGTSGTVKIDGFTKQAPFSVQNGAMTWDGCEFRHLPWVEDLRLNGVYTWEADPERYKANGMNAEPVIKFTSDGRFSDTGAVYYLNHIEHGYNENNSDNKYGDGRYEIKNHTLSLLFDDGRVYRYTYLNFEGNVQSPKEISVGQKFMKRK